VPSFRSSGSFGKRQEYIAVAELLRHGYDVYMTLVDDQQIDCVVRLEVDSHPVYIDVQIKARSAGAKQAGTFAALAVRDPRPNFMFVFYSECAGAYRVMPSLFDAWRDNWEAFNVMVRSLVPSRSGGI